MPENQAPDQVDIVAQNTQLHADLNTARQTIGTLQASVTSMTAERNTLRTQLDASNSNATALHAQVTTVTGERDAARTENGSLQVQMKDFNARLAAELSKHGIRPNGVPADNTPASPASGKLTVTEQCLIAKGLPLNHISASGGLLA